MISRRSLIAASGGLLLPSLTHAQEDISTGSTFAYPAGRTPGFDPTHPVASNTIASITPVVGQTVGIDFLRPGAVLTQTTVTASGIDRLIGPFTTHSGTRYRYDTGLVAGTTPVGVTLAAFISNGTTAAGTFPIASIPITALSNSYNIVLNSAGLVVSWNGTEVNPGFPAITSSHAYFFAASANASTTNFILLDLTNSQLLRTTGLGAVFVAISGGFSVGLDYVGNNFTGNIGSVMGSLSYNSMSNMLAWAADPWSFWYPQTSAGFGGL